MDSCEVSSIFKLACLQKLAAIATNCIFPEVKTPSMYRFCAIPQVWSQAPLKQSITRQQGDGNCNLGGLFR